MKRAKFDYSTSTLLDEASIDAEPVTRKDVNEAIGAATEMFESLTPRQRETLYDHHAMVIVLLGRMLPARGQRSEVRGQKVARGPGKRIRG